MIDKLERERKTTLTSLAALKKNRLDAYWVFTLQSSQLETSMLLCLLASQSSMISKGKQVMWHYVEDNLLSMLSQAAVDTKGKEYAHCLATVVVEIAVKIAALQEQEQQLEDLPVECTTEDDSSPDDPSYDMIDY